MDNLNNKNYIMRGNFNSHELEKYHLIFCPSYACNLSCKHCYLPSHQREGLNFPTAKKIVNAEIIFLTAIIEGVFFNLNRVRPV